MASLEQRFQAAANAVAHGPKVKQSNDVRLAFYAAYKQGMLGNAPPKDTCAPWDFEGHAKYNAWAALRGIPQDAAKQRYVDLFLQHGGSF